MTPDELRTVGDRLPPLPERIEPGANDVVGCGLVASAGLLLLVPALIVAGASRGALDAGLLVALGAIAALAAVGIWGSVHAVRSSGLWVSSAGVVVRRFLRRDWVVPWSEVRAGTVEGGRATQLVLFDRRGEPCVLWWYSAGRRRDRSGVRRLADDLVELARRAAAVTGSPGSPPG